MEVLRNDLGIIEGEAEKRGWWYVSDMHAYCQGAPSLAADLSFHRSGRCTRYEAGYHSTPPIVRAFQLL